MQQENKYHESPFLLFSWRHLFSALSLIALGLLQRSERQMDEFCSLTTSALPTAPPVVGWKWHEHETCGHGSIFTSNCVLSSALCAFNDLILLNTQIQNICQVLNIRGICSRHHHTDNYMGKKQHSSLVTAIKSPKNSDISMGASQVITQLGGGGWGGVDVQHICTAQTHPAPIYSRAVMLLTSQPVLSSVEAETYRHP